MAKKTLEINNLVKNREFNLPDTIADCRNPETGELSVSATVNGKTTYIPTGRVIAIPYDVYCLFRDINVIKKNMSYEGDFDPIIHETFN